MSTPETSAVEQNFNQQPIDTTESGLGLMLQNGRKMLGRAALVLGIVVGPAVSLMTGESVITSQSAQAATEFTNDYPDMDAVDCHLAYGQYSWCKGSPAKPGSPRGYDYRNCTDGAAY